MAQSIGKISFLSGTVKAVNASGEERILNVNDSINAGETIITDGAGSKAMISFNDQSTLAIGRNDQVLLDSDVFEPTQAPIEQNITSAEDIQQALLNDPNFDPTAELEATAAGAGGAGGSSSAGPVVINHALLGVNYDYLDTVDPARAQAITPTTVAETPVPIATDLVFGFAFIDFDFNP